MPYNKKEVILNMEATDLDIQFRFGESVDLLKDIGKKQSFVVIAESPLNKFNATGVGVYATSSGQKTKNRAIFNWLEHKY